MKPRFIPAASLRDEEWLLNLAPPVEGLWHLGVPLEDLEPRVAIVGARDATAYGLDVARTLAADLAARGIVVVSGMARGIDTEAHRGALSVEGGRTIAVLAGGPDKPYPRSSNDIYAEICARGAVVSENEPGYASRKEEFILRNRIIAGISDAIVIVQADAIRSGAMKTAAFAAGIGKPLLAVPGDLRSNLSSGPHELLRSKEVGICASAEDVLAAIGLVRFEDGERIPYIPPHLPSDQRRMLAEVMAGPARAPDLAARAKLELERAVRALGRLELDGFVRRDITGCYVAV